jgi:hypothetical protein
VSRQGNDERQQVKASFDEGTFLRGSNELNEPVSGETRNMPEMKIWNLKREGTPHLTLENGS